MRIRRVERLRFRIFHLLEGEAEGRLAICALVSLVLVALLACLMHY
jgi:hypothetical protein